MKNNLIVYIANFDVLDPRLILLRSYNYLYKLSNIEDGTFKLLFRRLQRLKSLRKIKWDFITYDSKPQIRWLKTLFKSLDFFSSLHLRAIIPLSRKLVSLNFGPFINDFRAAYCPNNFRIIKRVSRIAKKITLDLTDSIEDQSKNLFHLSKVFKRSKLESMYLHTSRFNALELTILCQKLQINPPRHLKIELSSERIVYERLSALIPFKDTLDLNVMIDFSKFKFGLSEIEERLRKLVLVVNFGNDPSQIHKIRVIERFSRLVDTSMILQFTWSMLKLCDLLDALRFPKSLEKMKLIIMGSREDSTPEIEASTEENYLDILSSEKKEIRRFLKHIGTLEKLHGIGLHFRVYGPLIKFYQHLVSAVCHSAPDSLRKLKCSLDRDESFKGKFDSQGFDCSSLAVVASQKPNLIQIYLVVTNPVLTSFKKPTNFQSLKVLIMSELNFGDQKQYEPLYEDFMRALAKSPLETLVFALSKTFFEIYSDLGTFKKLSSLQCKNKNLTLDGETAYKFVLAVCMKRMMRTLMVPVKFEMEEKKFEEICDMISKMRMLKALSFGSGTLGMLKDNVMSSIIVLRKPNPLPTIFHLAQQGFDSEDEDFEDEDNEFLDI